MDSNETNRLLSENTAAEATETLASSPVQTEEVKTKTVPKRTKEEVIARLKEIGESPEEVDKVELDQLKQVFYKLHKIEMEAIRAAFVEAGGNPDEFVPELKDTEARFKEAMNLIKEKKSAVKAEEEREKAEIIAKKQAIVDRLKELCEFSEDANKAYNEYKQLQQEWNETKQISTAKANELWKTYQLYAEKFYDLIKLNNEFREYDFKKNLEIKTHLCEAAEKLADESDVISAFHQLQKLHQEFRNIGPVAKELRESIWERFKAASTAVNRRHQQHFESLKEKEQHNLDEKTVICEIVEGLEYDTFTTFQDWDDKTQEVIALQAKWKAIGYAPQKMNVKIFERFRTACDTFFKRKTEFYKVTKNVMNDNLAKKRALCEQAEALKDSTEWKVTGEALSNLQKEWKTIGPVPKKYSETIWRRFIAACDHFYAEKSKVTDSMRLAELDNMAQKKAIIEKLNAIEADGNADDTAGSTVRALIKEWNSVGHVPFKEKDKLYKQYHTVVGKLFDRLNLSASQKKLSNFKSNLSKGENLYREREKLVRSYENMKNEIQTYENNIGFLSSSSKKGSSLVTEMNRKVEKLKTDLELIIKKIEVIDESLKEA